MQSIGQGSLSTLRIGVSEVIYTSTEQGGVALCYLHEGKVICAIPTVLDGV